MAFTVIWVPEAEAELASLWMSATDREGIRVAADQIEQRLRHDPHSAGESRSAGRRILIVPPLTVSFRVLDADRIAQVLHVREYPQRS